MKSATATATATARRHMNGSSGSATVSAMLLFAAVMAIFLLVCEFVYAFTLKQSLDEELTRAVNIAVDLAISDAYRQDRQSELDSAAAYDHFYEYLQYDMNLSSFLEARRPGGGRIYRLEIKAIDIKQSPPSMRVIAYAVFEPAFFGKLVPVTVRLTVRGNSLNRRKD